MQQCILSSGELDKELLDLCISSLSFTHAADGTKIATSGLTMEEIKAAVQTNALSTSQTTTTTTTLGLGTAFQGLGIKIKEATASMWTFLTTNPLGWATLAAGTIAALAFGVKKYNDSIEEAKESARERTAELFDEFNEMNDTLTDHKKTVSELADRYDELSKGVNLSNNENLSLSTEEYKEFLGINEQLTQSFPELAKGIDENGNSILTLGTKGITAKEQLEELLQAEEDLNNFRIAQGLEEAFKGVYTYVEDANEATDKLNGTISDSSEAISKLQDIAENGINLAGDNGQLIFGGNIHNEAELNYMNALTDSVNEFWKSLDGSRRVELSGLGIDSSTLFRNDLNSDTGIFEIYADTYNLTSEEITELENIIKDNVGDASGALLDSISDQSQELREQVQKGENAWTDFIPTLVSGMKSKQTFKNLDSDLQDIAIQIVEGLDYSYADAMKEWDPDPYAYVRDKIIDPLSKLDDTEKEKIISSFEELFKLDIKDLSQDNQAEIEKFITTIATLLEKDPLEIRVALGFDIEDIQNRYNTALNKAKHQLGGYSYNDRGVEATNDVGKSIQDFWEENVVTEEDWILWQKVTEGITDATEAINVYTEAKNNANDVEIEETNLSPSITQTIDQLNTQLRPTMDALKSAYQNIFTDDGFTLENVDVSMLDSIRSTIDELNSMEDVDINIDYSSFDNLAKVLTDISSTKEDVHEAIDSFATVIVDSLNPAISECDGESYKLMQTLLESMGIVNAEEVLIAELGYSYEEYTAAKEAAANSSVDLNDNINEVASSLENEGLMASIDAQQIMTYMIAKAAADGATINVDDTLFELAKEYEWLAELINQWGLYNTVSQKGHGNTSGTKNLGAGNYTPVQSQPVKEKVDVKFNGSKAGKSSSGGGSSSSKDTWKEAYEAELKELEHMHEMGKFYALFYSNVE